MRLLLTTFTVLFTLLLTPNFMEARVKNSAKRGTVIKSVIHYGNGQKQVISKVPLKKKTYKKI